MSRVILAILTAFALLAPSCSEGPARTASDSEDQRHPVPPGREYELLNDPEALAIFLQPLPPKEPQEALATFETLGGFEMQLVAAEPLVTDPIAGAFDEHGRLYVAEMRDYPYQPDEGEKPIGRVRLLEDDDGDGRFDRSHVFAEELLWPSGIAPWKGGVFVSAPPDIWYFRDNDGDGRADERLRVYTGFSRRGEQYMLNNLKWGVDHLIYGATGSNGGAVRAVDDPMAKKVSVERKDFRFDPVGGGFETTSSTFQFGNTFDDWFNRFVCNQAMPARHSVLSANYLSRNPELTDASDVNALADGWTRVHKKSPIEAWRRIRQSRRLAAGRSIDSPAVSHDFLTAGAGVTVYRGDAYPKKYHGNLFIGATTANLVHRRVLKPDGVTFRSDSGDVSTDFVRSTDNWFRPVNFINAPDGTLYVLDMAREFTESVHVAKNVVKLIDLTSGRDRGRVYRIAPPGFDFPGPLRLGEASTAALVADLESPNGWRRDTAHRLIYERQDEKAVPLLRRLVTSRGLPQARMHALWSLEGLAALRDEDLLIASSDLVPGVREHSVRLSERRLGNSELLAKVLTLADDPSPRVRLQVALSLGESDDPRTIEGLMRIARRDVGDRWVRTALLSSSGDSPDVLFDRLVSDQTFIRRKGAKELLSGLAKSAAAHEDPTVARRVLDVIARWGGVDPSGSMHCAVVVEMASTLDRSGRKWSDLVDRSSPPGRLIDQLLTQAERKVKEDGVSRSELLEAIRLLRYGEYERAEHVLVPLLGSQKHQRVQVAAVDTLTSFGRPETATVLLDSWARYLPATRVKVTRELLSRDAWILPFLRAVENEAVSTNEIDPTRRNILLQHENDAVRNLASELFAGSGSRSREDVIARYRGALSSPTDRLRGARVYARECAVCHRLGTTEHPLGPNLLLSTNRSAELLLANILDPNRYVDPRYVQYVVADRSGKVHTGMIVAESDSRITLRRGQDDQITLARSGIEEIQATGISIMPEGLEARITPAEMADLIAFLVASQYDPGTDAGSHAPGS